MTSGAFLAVAAAVATEGRSQALSPGGEKRVASVLGNYDGMCWAHNCEMQLSACTSLESACFQHFLCGQQGQEGAEVFATEAMRSCFGEARWEDLSERELGMFACARDSACMSEGHPALSFLEAELRLRKASAVQEEEPASLIQEEEMSQQQTSTIAAVLQLRALRQAAQTRATHVQELNALTDLRAAHERLSKLLQIKHPASKDVVAMQAIQIHLKRLDQRLDRHKAMVAARAEEQPLDLAALAKLSPQEALAPHLKQLDQAFLELRRGSYQPDRRMREAVGTKYVLDALKLAKLGGAVPDSEAAPAEHVDTDAQLRAH